MTSARDALPVHPFTGMTALAVMPSGRPVWPVLGAEDNPAPGSAPPAGAGTPAPAGPPASGQQPAPGQPSEPVRPDGISDEEWAALGDPGRRAIERERRKAREAERARQQAERERDEARRAAQAGTGQPTGQPPAAGQSAPPAQPATQDLAALLQTAVSAAVQPLLERDAQRSADRVRDRIQALAGPVLHNPADALQFLDLPRLVTATGDPDEQAIRDGLARLAEERPYLARPVEQRQAAPGSGQGGSPGGGQLTQQQRVQKALALMNPGAAAGTTAATAGQPAS